MISRWANIKKFKWLSYTILVIILLIITGFTLLSVSYDKAIIKYLKKYLDEHLLTEIIVSKIDFSFFKKFPYGTVEFSDVFVKSRKAGNPNGLNIQGADTLLYAKNIFFQFSIIELLNKKYHLKKVILVDGKMNLLIDSSGNKNFQIWKSSEKEKPTEDYHFKFNNITLSSINLNLYNAKDSYQINCFTKKSVFSGEISKNAGIYALKSQMLLFSISHHNHVYMNNIPITMNLRTSHQDDKIILNQAKINLNKLLLQLDGTLILKPNIYIDINAISSNFGLDEIFSILPFNKKNQWLSGYSLAGKGKMSAHLKGQLNEKRIPQITTSFIINNGSLSNKNTKTKLSDININGSLSGNNIDNIKLELKTFNARLSTGIIKGNLAIKNFKSPEFRTEIYSTIYLNNLYHLFDIDTFEYLNGQVNIEMKAEDKFAENEKINLLNLLNKSISGSLEFNDCNFKIKEADYSLEDINGKVIISKYLYLDNLSITLNQSNFIISGSVDKLFSYLADKKSIINSNLYIHSKAFNLKSFISSDNKNINKKPFSYPPFLYLTAKFSADELLIGKFNGTNLKCDLQYQDKSLFFKEFYINFKDGLISGNSLINQKPDSCFFVNCNASLKKIDIQLLFSAFNNFGQKFIIDENLKGKLNGNVNFSSCWDQYLNFIPSSLTAQADIEILNGELLKFDPMLSLSKYINIEELRHIRFKTIRNTISISDRNILIPEMYINSSAFNIYLSGKHSFDNSFDYRLKVSLSDVLFKKAKRKNQNIDDYLIMENDENNTVIPLSIIGKPDDYKVEFDSKKAFKLIKERLNHESAEIKQIFNKDNTSVKQNEDNRKSFKVEWEEENVSPDTGKYRKNKTDDEYRIKWDEEDSSD